jgi:DNA mismatch endonuclease (patch repair protein)
MPSGIFTRSKSHNQHIADALRSKKKSGTHIQHIKDAHERSKEKYKKASKRHSKFMSNHNPMKGKPQCEKQRLAIAKYNKNRVFSVEEREARRQNSLTHPNRKFKETSIELIVENELIRRGINYVKQVPLCKIAIVDFYLPEYRTIIQCDGCYWHNCSIHNKNPLEGRTEKDIKQDSVLTFNGFNVYRLWEHDINESVEKCIDSLGLR